MKIAPVNLRSHACKARRFSSEFIPGYCSSLEVWLKPSWVLWSVLIIHYSASRLVFVLKDNVLQIAAIFK
jgi:hypothetical protein